ncbi:MAG: acyl-CoA thioesterase [Bryobacteraceae bacterium]
MNTELAPFELTIPVEPADIDALGHVNNVAYLRWVQDAAVAHWRAIASAEDQARLLWVVVRWTRSQGPKKCYACRSESAPRFGW